MPRKTLTTIAAAGLLALGGVAVGAGPANAATCPAGQHWNAMGGGAGFCSPDGSGGGTGGNGTYTGDGRPQPAPKAPVLVQPKIPTAPVYPTLTKAGAVLKADQSGWAKGTVLKYRWTRNGVTISGATSATYKVRSADKGKTVTVVVTGKKSGHSTSKTARKFIVS
jgi:hypothetical protein